MFQNNSMFNRAPESPFQRRLYRDISNEQDVTGRDNRGMPGEGSTNNRPGNNLTGSPMPGENDGYNNRMPMTGPTSNRGNMNEFPNQGMTGNNRPTNGMPGGTTPGNNRPMTGAPNQGMTGNNRPMTGFPNEGMTGNNRPMTGFPNEGMTGNNRPMTGFPNEGMPGNGGNQRMPFNNNPFNQMPSQNEDRFNQMPVNERPMNNDRNFNQNPINRRPFNNQPTVPGQFPLPETPGMQQPSNQFPRPESPGMQQPSNQFPRPETPGMQQPLNQVPVPETPMARPPVFDEDFFENDNQKVLDLLLEALTDEKEDFDYYSRLINMFTEPEDKDIIRSIMMDEQKHYLLISDIYYKLTGRQPVVEQIVRPIGRNLGNEIGEQLLRELEGADLYRKLYFAFLNLQFRDMLFEALTDEQSHAAKMNYLFAKNR